MVLPDNCIMEVLAVWHCLIMLRRLQKSSEMAMYSMTDQLHVRNISREDERWLPAHEIIIFNRHSSLLFALLSHETHSWTSSNAPCTTQWWRHLSWSTKCLSSRIEGQHCTWHAVITDHSGQQPIQFLGLHLLCEALFEIENVFMFVLKQRKLRTRGHGLYLFYLGKYNFRFGQWRGCNAAGIGRK